jgi:thiamine-monophosphate kinase
LDDRELLHDVMDIIGRENCLDDCAVLPCGDRYLVASTDMLHEKSDFPAGMSGFQMGWMAIAVTLSDIASMGARPWFVLLAAGLDRDERLKEIMQGAKVCCDEYGVILAGGDLDHHAELTLVSTGVGEVAKDRLVRRRGSGISDALCITGMTGRAQAALEGHHQFDNYLFQPVPRVHEGQTLAHAGVTSMMDISDGLVISLYDLVDANGCGYAIESGYLPLIPGMDKTKSIEYSLYGGGDFELLFTCPEDLLPVTGVDATRIGTVIDAPEVLVDGGKVPKKGYQHFWC